MMTIALIMLFCFDVILFLIFLAVFHDKFDSAFKLAFDCHYEYVELLKSNMRNVQDRLLIAEQDIEDMQQIKKGDEDGRDETRVQFASEE